MFTLKKILNGRINVSEPLHMASGVTGATTFPSGAAVAYVSGKLTPCSADSTAEYIVRETTECKAASDTVPLTLVTKDMIFEAPCASAGVKVGSKYQFASDGLSVGSGAVSSGFGAYVVDTLGATAAGDPILVRLA